MFKRVIALFLFLILLNPVIGQCKEDAYPTANPFIIILSLPASDDMAPSGSSIFTIITKSSKLVAGSTNTMKDMDLTDANFMFQLSAVTPTSTVSLSGASVMASGDNWYSGVTLSYWYRESLLNTTEAWNKATKVYIVSGLNIASGNTPIQVLFYPKAMGYIQYGLDSGVSAFGGTTAYVAGK